MSKESLEIAKAAKENAQLREENNVLRIVAGIPANAVIETPGSSSSPAPSSTTPAQRSALIPLLIVAAIAAAALYLTRRK